MAKLGRVMYEYKATVIKVYDGDTITVDFDLGFGIVLKKQTIRLFGINTPEVRGAEKADGIISRDALRQRILGKQVIIKTSKDKPPIPLPPWGWVKLLKALRRDGLTLQSNHSRSSSKGHDSSHPDAALAFQQPRSVARDRQPASCQQRSEPH